MSKTQDSVFKKFIEKIEELGFSDIELEILTIDSLKNLAENISSYMGYLHVYTDDYQLREKVREIIENENNNHVSKEDRVKIINLFKTLLSRTTKYDLDNKYKYDFILGEDLLNQFKEVLNQFKEVPALLDLASLVVRKNMGSGDQKYLSTLEEIPNTLQHNLKTNLRLQHRLRINYNNSLDEESKINLFLDKTFFIEYSNPGLGR